MFTEFILTSFAAFIGWTIFKSSIWFYVPARLTTILVLAISYGITFLSKPSFLVALAATGGCAVLFRFISSESVEPWKFPSISLSRKNTRSSQRNSPMQKRIPRL